MARELSETEWKFLKAYIRTMKIADGCKASGMSKNEGESLVVQPYFKDAMENALAAIKDDTIATANEVLKYLTSVMRGEVKDQFGLDAPLSERTKAATELAKRTIDFEAKSNTQDTIIQVKLDWGRDDNDRNGNN